MGLRSLYCFGLACIGAPLLATALPQATAGIDDIPSCAYAPLISALKGTGCALTDIPCVCSQSDLIPSISSQVLSACSGELDEGDISNFVATVCGTSETPSASSSASSAVESVSTAAAAASSSSSSSASKSSEAATTPASTPASTTETEMMPTITPAYCIGNGTMPSNVTPTSQDSSPSDTPTIVPSNVGNREGYSMLAFAIAVGGMTWAFAEL